MKLLLIRFRNEWASWLAVAFIALLPFERLAEIPLSTFAISLAFIARTPDGRRRIRAAATFVLPLFLCFWIPLLVSSLDSFYPAKSWSSSLAALRYLAAALAMAVLLNPPSARERVLRWSAWLLLFWAFDAFVQLFAGRDLFGVAMHPDRLNAMFTKNYMFFGPTLAMLSPLVLEHARRHWRPFAWAVSFALILGAVMIAGMRSGASPGVSANASSIARVSSGDRPASSTRARCRANRVSRTAKSTKVSGTSISFVRLPSLYFNV